jgi:uncharacterized protein (DUF952 family)
VLSWLLVWKWTIKLAQIKAQTNMAAIFHIAERAQWEAAQVEGAYQHPSLVTEGFIHCSTVEQVIWVANAFFRGQAGLVLLEIAAEALDNLKFDAVAGVGVFPHVYGTIDLKAVRRVFAFEPNQDGEFELPVAINPDHPEISSASEIAKGAVQT